MQTNAQILCKWELPNGGWCYLANNTFNKEPWVWVHEDEEGVYAPYPFRMFKNIWVFKHFIDSRSVKGYGKEKR